MRTSLGTSVRFVPLLGVVLAAVLAAAPVGAATITVPPVTIFQFERMSEEPGYPVVDAITIPGSGYTASPFAATIATDDLISIRVQAPPGKQFVVHAPATFFLSVYWYTNIPDISPAYLEPHAVTFENLKGPVPTETYSLVTLGGERKILTVWKNYQVNVDLEFTAFAIDVTAAHPFDTVARDFSVVGSWNNQSIGASGPARVPDAPIMEIVDIATPSHLTSWGRLKSLYR